MTRAMYNKLTLAPIVRINFSEDGDNVYYVDTDNKFLPKADTMSLTEDELNLLKACNKV